MFELDLAGGEDEDGLSSPQTNKEVASVGGEQLLFYQFGGGIFEKDMRSGAVALIDADWLIEFAKCGRKLPPRQQLPVEAFTSFESLVQRSQPFRVDPLDGLYHTRMMILETDEDSETMFHMGLKIIALSYMWLSKDHPDPDATTLKTVAEALEAFVYDDNSDLGTRQFLGGWGVFWDFCSLYQHPDPKNGIRRTETEEALFKQGLKAMPWFYQHGNTTVFQVTELPGDRLSLRCTNRTPYLERGWPFFEACLTYMGKPAENCINLSKLTAKSSQYLEIYAEALNRKQVPLLPAQFETISQSLTFSNGRNDQDLVNVLYQEHFEAIFSNCTYLDFSHRGWTDMDAEHLLQILASGAAPNLQELDISFNELSSTTMDRLAETTDNTSLHTILVIGNKGDDLVSHVPSFQARGCELKFKD